MLPESALCNFMHYSFKRCSLSEAAIDDIFGKSVQEVSIADARAKFADYRSNRSRVMRPAQFVTDDEREQSANNDAVRSS